MITKSILLLLLVASSISIVSGSTSENSVEASPSLKIDFVAKSSRLDFMYGSDLIDENSEILVTLSTSARKNISIDRIGPEGGPPSIVSAFTSDANRDGENELFLIVSWETRHQGLNTTGTYYKVFAYKYSKKDEVVCHVPEVENDIGSGLVGIREGKVKKFRYTNAVIIRKHFRYKNYIFSKYCVQV